MNIKTPGLSVDLEIEIDWYAFGRTFTEAESDEQAAFLKSIATRFTQGGTDMKMQLAYIGQSILDDSDPNELEDLRNLFEALLEQIKEATK